MEQEVAILDEREAKERLEADIADRRTFIGGSDAPIILGLAAWKSRYELYLEKIGEKEPDDLSDVERVQWGQVLEDVVATMYMRRTGKKVRRVNNRIIDKTSSFPRVVQIDRRIVGGGILEIKTTDAMMGGEWGPEGTAEIPTKVYAQVQHQLAVTDETIAEVAALIGGNRMKLYIVPRDEEFIRDMTAAEEAFWNNCQSRTPPAPITVEEASQIWSKAPSVPVVGTTLHGTLAAELLALQEQRKELEKREDEIELDLKKAIADAGDTLVVNGTAVATWKQQTRTMPSTKLLSERYPDIAKEVTVTSEFRVFRLTKGAADFRGIN